MRRDDNRPNALVTNRGVEVDQPESKISESKEEVTADEQSQQPTSD